MCMNVKIRSFSAAGKNSTPTLDKSTEARIAKLVSSSRVVVFMKGNPAEPRCGFSNAVCRILEVHGVLGKVDAQGVPLVASCDVLDDEEIRSGAKLFSDWPTFPQVFFDGEFVGGCDILLDMHKSGKLAEELERRGIGSVIASQGPPSGSS